MVQNLEGGIVQNIFVQEGEEVAAGQVLLDFEQIVSQPRSMKLKPVWLTYEQKYLLARRC